MAAEGYLPTATLIIDDNGQVDSWEFDLGPEAPLGDSELLDALVREFLPGNDPSHFQLSRSGTAAKPVFRLKRVPPSPFRNPRRRPDQRT
jgi:hypothetical protein